MGHTERMAVRTTTPELAHSECHRLPTARTVRQLAQHPTIRTPGRPREPLPQRQPMEGRALAKPIVPTPERTVQPIRDPAQQRNGGNPMYLKGTNLPTRN